jgi:ferredoxin, 2Fe-2S
VVHVRVEPSGVVVEVGDGETLMAAAERAGHRWPTICGGQAQCTACHVVVGEGADRLGPIPADEDRALGPLRHRYPVGGPMTVRLACRARPTGDVTVHKPGVRPAGSA